jgi:hypothetical protein
MLVRVQDSVGHDRPSSSPNQRSDNINPPSLKRYSFPSREKCNDSGSKVSCCIVLVKAGEKQQNVSEHFSI